MATGYFSRMRMTLHAPVKPTHGQAAVVRRGDAGRRDHHLLSFRNVAHAFRTLNIVARDHLVKAVRLRSDHPSPLTLDPLL